MLGLCFAALGTSQLLPGEAKLPEAEVIRLANEAGRKKGYDLKKYDAPKAHYTRKDNAWFVFYQGKMRAPGNFFSV
jgi:hypothetical protein